MTKIFKFDVHDSCKMQRIFLTVYHEDYNIIEIFYTFFFVCLFVVLCHMNSHFTVTPWTFCALYRFSIV